MAQKKRTGITSSINSNIYDNGNKEIFAAMVREVLDDVKDSYFNLLDDQLANMKFNNEKTLQQYLNEIAGSKPETGAVLDVDGNAGATENNPIEFRTDGIISSAYEILTSGGQDILYEINFAKSIGTRQLIPVLEYGNGVNWNKQNDFTTPVIRRISTTRINLAIREISRAVQNFDIRIIVI